MENNYAFIDAQNLYLSIKKQGWKIDYSKFRRFLKEKYYVTNAYMFIGFVKDNQKLYKDLQESGFILIFRPTLKYSDGKTKGNCDSEMVLHSMIEYPNYSSAILVSSDGDFFCLAEHLRDTGKLKAFLVPDMNSYSALLKGINTPESKYLAFLSDFRNKIEYTHIRKGPPKDEP